MELLTKTQIASYFIVLFQMFFTIAVSFAYFLSDKTLSFGILVLGYILLAFSFFTLVLPSVLSKRRKKK